MNAIPVAFKMTRSHELHADQIEVRQRALADVESVRRNRKLRNDFGEAETPAPTSLYLDLLGSDYPVPDWLLTENFTDERLGHIKSGKEGEVFLVERRSASDSCLLALKTYKDPSQRAFRRDQIYREGRKIRRTRDRRAVELGTAYGRKFMQSDWMGAEFEILRDLWLKGVRVPYPVDFAGGLLMQYLGDWEQAAPRLVQVRLDHEEARYVFEQVMQQILGLARAGMVHADLSAYNILYWQEEPWIIDFPQAVAIPSNPHSIELLMRDIANVCSYFEKYGVQSDPGEWLALAMTEVYSS